MNILSLFDGISAGQVALERAGIEVTNYYASEVDKYAIQVTQKNYPNTIQLGDVKLLDPTNLPKIDMLIGGSPCTNFSFAGKRKGMATKDNIEITSLEQYLELKGQDFEFEGQSYLFWEYMRILGEVKPKYFLLENVAMVKKWQDVLSSAIGVEPIVINSNLLSAQNRKRLYWTNIPNIEQPEDKGILLKDVIHENIDNHLSEKELGYMLRGNEKWTGGAPRIEKYLDFEEEKSKCITANFNKGVPYNCFFQELAEYVVPFDKTLQILDKEVQRGKVGYFRKDSQANRVYYIHDKAVTLCGEAGGGAAKMGQYLFGCITPDRINKRQNGQRFSEGRKFYTLTAQDKHGILIEGYIRKLTPVECERLQTFEEGYTAGISNSQRYKCLGNSWTVDIVSHIFKNLL